MFELTSFLDAAPRKVVLTTHWNPDGDAVGSTLGLLAVLRSRGHEVDAVFPNAPSTNLHWMPLWGTSGVWVDDVAPDSVDTLVQQADLVMALDYNHWSRTGESLSARLALFQGTTALLDHHPQPDASFSFLLSDTTASSTCELVERWVHQAGWSNNVDAGAATCLFTGMLTDTGSFRYPSTSAHTLAAAARMVEAGAFPESIHERLFDALSPQRMLLWGEALRGMQFWESGKLAVLTLDKPTLDKIGYAKGDSDGLVNQGLAVKGVEVSAFFREEAAGVKISFRSKGSRDVNAFSREYFAGGGHVNAAGGFFAGSLQEALVLLKKVSTGWLAALLLSAGLMGCTGREAGETRMDQTSASADTRLDPEAELIQQHRDQLAAERRSMDRFIADRGWIMQTGGTGWKLWRVEKGAGAALQTGDGVELTARATDLRNKVFYRYPASKPFVFRLGRDNVGEIGLHEVLLGSRRGDSLVVVLPAHLAHGVAGDLHEIPPMSPVVYYLRVR